MLTLVKTFGSMAVILFATSAFSVFEPKVSLKTEAPKKLNVEIVDGVVAIEGTTQSQLSYEVEKIDFTKSCKFQVIEKNDEVKIEVKRVGGYKKSKCTTNIKIYAPTNLDLKASLQSGDLNIQGLSGKLELSQNTGAVFVNSVVNGLILNVGKARAEVQGLVGSAKINSTRGDVKLVMTSEAKEATLNVTSASGNVDIEIPQGISVNHKVLGLKSHLNVEVENDKNSHVQINAKIGLGKLYLKRTN